MSTDKPYNFSAQLTRMFDHAAIEASHDEQRGGQIYPDHLMIAALQDADVTHVLYVYLMNNGLTIRDIRTGQIAPKAQGDLPLKA